MSEAEYECLIAGGRLMNATDHNRERGQKTDSVGFCFFPEGLLRESYGTYRDPSRDDLMQPAPSGGRPTMRKREYCLTSYSLSDGVRVISMTDKYADYAQIRRDFVKMGLMQP